MTDLNDYQLVFTMHVLEQMDIRGIEMDEVKAVLRARNAIREYPDDKPFPSKLYLGMGAVGFFHVVAATNPKTMEIHIITTYRPDPTKWTEDYRMRRKG